MTAVSSEPESGSMAEPTAAPPNLEAKRKRRRTSMSVINFWLDSFILIMLMLLGWVSVILQVAFPAPTTAAGWTLWGLSYDQWRDIQFATLCGFGLGIVVHVMLHWNWVCSVIFAQIMHSRNRPDEGMQTIYGVAFLIALLHVIGAGLVLALFFVRHPPV